MQNQIIKYLLFSSLLFTLNFTYSQTDPSALLKIYLDCQRGCDREYFREEIKFVDFMRDRQEAEVFLQLTEERTGNGGREYTLRIVGQKIYEGSTDTIRFYTDPDATDNVERNEVLKGIKKAILPYLIQTPIADQIEYSVPEELTLESQNKTIENDPWNSWVFRISGNGFLSGEESFKNSNISSFVSASRVTDESKFSFFSRYRYQKSKFKLSDEEEIISINRSAFARILYAKSINERWTYGGWARISNSTFSNIDLQASVKPGIEYSIWPYKEATQRKLTALYQIGPVYYNYQDTTILDLVKQTIIQQSLTITFDQIKDWGTVEFFLNIENYPTDLSYISISFGPELEWNIVKGLNIDLGAHMSYIGDRINIAKSGISDEDILLRNRQLDSSFDYFVFMGLSYRFGSSTNNVVNTRFND